MSIFSDLERFSVRAKKRLGQNFLVDEKVLKAIAHAAPVAGEHIVEVGPGFGALTTFLSSQKPATLDLVEYDPVMVSILQERAEAKEFMKTPAIHLADALKWKAPAGSYRVFGNIPYYITSPILRRFLYDVENSPESCVFLVQKEVADKILLSDKKHSVLSLLVHWRAENISHVVDALAKCFRPAPKVDSAAIRIDVAERPDRAHTDKFLKLIHAGFAEKRKQLAGNLARAFGGGKASWEEKLSTLGLRPDIRAEDVPLEAWKKLSSV